MLARCRYDGCCAQVRFVRSPSGKATMAMDALPFARGEVDRGWVITPTGVASKDGVETAPEVYVDHHATCPGIVRANELVRLRRRCPALAVRVDAYAGPKRGA